MVSTAGIIIIGDEILSGRTKDSNINWIATELNNIGVRLIEARIVSDDSETIIETCKQMFTIELLKGRYGALAAVHSMGMYVAVAVEEQR